MQRDKYGTLNNYLILLYLEVNVHTVFCYNLGTNRIDNMQG